MYNTYVGTIDVCQPLIAFLRLGFPDRIRVHLCACKLFISFVEEEASLQSIDMIGGGGARYLMVARLAWPGQFTAFKAVNDKDILHLSQWTIYFSKGGGGRRCSTYFIRAHVSVADLI